MNDVLQKIHEVADVYTDKHFVYTGEAHGDGYVNYRALGQSEHISILREAGVLILTKMVELGKINPNLPIMIVGPETLGALMAEQIGLASHTELPFQVDFMTLKKMAEEKIFYWSAPPTRILNHPQIVWVDDLLNAGSTFESNREMIKSVGGKLVAIGVIGDRSGLFAAQLGVPHVEALERFTLNRYERNCPLCEAHEPIVRSPGHGHEFELAYPNYLGGFVDI